MAMVADHLTQSGTRMRGLDELVVDDQRAGEEVLDMLHVMEEHAVEHHARQHRTGSQHIERHQHDIGASCALS